MTVITALITLKNTLSQESTQYKMICTIMKNIYDVTDYTIYDLAELCNVSTASIMRLCNNLGYKSYSTFRSELKKTVDNFSFYNRILPIAPMYSFETVTESLTDIAISQAHSLRSINSDTIDAIIKTLHESTVTHLFFEEANNAIVSALETNLVIDGNLVYQHNARIFDVSKFTSDSCALFLMPNYILHTPFLTVFDSVIKTPAKTIVIAYSYREEWKKSDITLYIPDSTHTYADTLCMDILLEIISELYRSRYIDNSH